jgi:hypothetical protein
MGTKRSGGRHGVYLSGAMTVWKEHVISVGV